MRLQLVPAPNHHQIKPIINCIEFIMPKYIPEHILGKTKKFQAPCKNFWTGQKSSDIILKFLDLTKNKSFSIMEKQKQQSITSFLKHKLNFKWYLMPHVLCRKHRPTLWTERQWLWGSQQIFVCCHRCMGGFCKSSVQFCAEGQSVVFGSSSTGAASVLKILQEV